MVLRWWISGLRMGEVTFASNLRTSHIYGAYMRFLGWTLLYSIAMGIVGGAVAIGIVAMTKSGQKSELTEFIAGAIGIVVYVLAMLGYSTIYQATAKFGIWWRGV